VAGWYRQGHQRRLRSGPGRKRTGGRNHPARHPLGRHGRRGRRAWARNEPSIETCIQYNELRKGSDHITLPYLADERLIGNLVEKAFAKHK